MNCPDDAALLVPAIKRETFFIGDEIVNRNNASYLDSAAPFFSCPTCHKIFERVFGSVHEGPLSEAVKVTAIPRHE